MINVSDAFRTAVSADTRRTAIKVDTDVVDPDIIFGEVEATSEAEVSQSKQLYDSHDEPDRYATLEHNFWLLDSSFDVFADAYKTQEVTEKVGFVSDAVSGSDKAFSTSQVIAIPIQYNGLLQATSAYFSTDPVNGIPTEFTIKIYVGDLVVAQWSATGNEAYESLPTESFEAYNPTKIEITIAKWSLTGRRIRLRQFIPGLHLTWSGDDIASLTVKQQGDPSCATIPYGTAKLAVDNSKQTFEPRNKKGFFKSIQARQKVLIAVGVYVQGEPQYVPLGTFYQHSGGWTTSDNGLSIDWDLVDIIGLMNDRDYEIPHPLPTTLNGWVQSIVSQLGINFANRFHVDPAYRDLPITVPNKKAVDGISNGDMLRFLGLATGTWPRADAKTGLLVLEPLWDQGVRMTLDNMNVYPTMSENDDVGTVTITEPEWIDRDSGTVSEEEKYVYGGTNLAASRSIGIASPFVQSSEDADKTFRRVIQHYGGNAYSAKWRGDPTAEVGDVVTLELDKSNGASARLLEQTFDYSSGVLANCEAHLIQPQGYYTYAYSETITADGTWTVPEDVHVIQVILVGGGQAGSDGENGSYQQAGLDGWDGSGGKIFHSSINVVPGTAYAVTIGQGSTDFHTLGTASTFGSYSSDNGKVYSPSYTDIKSGRAFGRTGVKSPLPNTGDGGAGGKGGAKGEGHTVKEKDEYGFVTEKEVADVKPGKGEKGSKGASGCVVIYWN